LPIVSIVDDDVSVRSATAKLLRLCGFVPQTFASAEDFLHSPSLDETACVITDLRMPGMSGLELQSHLIAHGKRIPMIFITAFPVEGSQAKALEAGAAGFLIKPFVGDALIGCLRKVLSGAKRPE
jgi:FixJ family two-component response regulator